ncbi:HEAT and Armadillo domain-containing protein 1 [Rozella allomycis CSF55]|uniref:HEAT and Armadillo domain-containing protein 1 n=1 Tax=Rozella allomycis (strain CSF55) TaxID=988480 RepID=A0A075AMQ4_ROZAC|nr:HEAT and Armadillo domain-containing protein 1 [Rozella allomycis CSF55]|eukprot:EPZ30946.1 HEAT and Armadillo domain-containing protein 1 [Rozella allomycis CSF55]
MTFEIDENACHRARCESILRDVLLLFITYGETKGLYEFCNSLLDLLTGAFKLFGDDDRVVLSVLGSVMEKVGSRVSTIGVEACIKNTVRIESIETLMKTLNGVGKAINEGIHKDVFKVMKGLMSDKNAQVRISAANCLNSLFMTSTIAIQFSEVENLVLFVLKCFDESELFRKALAKMIGNILASTQKPQCGVKIVDKKKKIVNKEGEQGGICSVIEMLNLLYTPISKMNGLSHETCMGLIEIYSVLFSILGAEIFEEEMTMVISHVLSFLDLPKIPSENMRESVGFIMKSLCLNSTEPFKIKMIQCVGELLKQNEKKEELNDDQIVCVLNQVSLLFVELDSLVSGAQEGIIEPLFNLLVYSSKVVQVNGARCLRMLVSAQPSLLSKFVNRLLNMIEKDMFNVVDDSKLLHKLYGHVIGLASILNVVNKKPLYISSDLILRIISKCMNLLKKEVKEASNVLTVQQTMAWILLTPLMALESNFIKIQLVQLMLFWNSIFSKNEALPTNEEHLMRYISVRLASLTCLNSFMFHQKPLMNLELTKRISKIVENALNVTPKVYEAINNNPINYLLVTRLFQCFSNLPVDAFESSATRLLQVCLDTFLKLPFDTSELFKRLNKNEYCLAKINKRINFEQFSKFQTSYENDTASVIASFLDEFNVPNKSSVLVINESIKLAARVAANQNVITQESCLNALLQNLKNGKENEEKILLFFSIFISEIKTIGSNKLIELSQELIQMFILHPDEMIRCIACEILGKLVKVNGQNEFTSNLIKTLVDQLINNKDCVAKGSFGLAIGCVMRELGSMTVGAHVKTVIGILMSLSSDANEIVSVWCLHSLSITIESSGIYFEEYLNPLMNLLNKLWFSLTNETNYEMMSKLLLSLIGMIGPELITIVDKCLIMMDWMFNQNESIINQGLLILQQIILFAPNVVDYKKIIPIIQTKMLNKNNTKGCVTCLRQLIQRDYKSVLKYSNYLINQFLAFLKDENNEIKETLIILCKFISIEDPFLILEISKNAQSGTNLIDLNNVKPENVLIVENILNSKLNWKTLVFLIQLLQISLKTNSNSEILIPKIHEFIKVSFNASTSVSDSLRLQGLLLLEDILLKFSLIEDPEFAGHSILEQYQAQITSAITPVFSSDVIPEIQSIGIKICSVYVSSGVSKDISTLGRILKPLTNCLDKIKGFFYLIN